ncbi:MAG TPA: Xaa-Pro peptidase family protein [Gemmatimonadales bacterium]|nr:Xaa-Pro peptidase family protein [Gemmatimonadales bacterium]
MTPARHRERQIRLRQELDGRELDAMLFTAGANLRYLTGFSGTAGLLLAGTARAVLVTDFRYAAQAAAEVDGVADVEVVSADLWDRLRKVLAGRGRLRLGFDREATSVRDAERLASLPGVETRPTSGIVEGLRAVKDADEVAAIEAAIGVAQAALAEVLPTILPGQSETEVAARLEHALRIRGSEWHPFPTIVASGPRSALPHARASTRTIARGEWLLIDFGAAVRGYCADLTRTVVVGPADTRQREIYGIVEQAQRAARGSVRAGMSGREADALARDPIAAAGYGAAFGHSLGHGIGLEVHEAPRLARTAEEALPAGAVVTVEPGIYLEGWGGVRLEDDVHLPDAGPRCLSDGRVDLLELI